MVTANKALLAEDGAALLAEAADAGRRRPLLRGRRRRRDPADAAAARVAGRRPDHAAWLGIVNGTTNFILSAMDSHRRRATPRRSTRPPALGYAEADPTADVDGYDAAAKAAILASIAFHTRVTAADVYREGIPTSPPADIAAARRAGLRDQAAGDLRAHDGDGTATASRRGSTRR